MPPWRHALAAAAAIARSGAVFAVAAMGLLARSGTAADQAAPVGPWTTIDDATHEARAVVEIDESNGALSGRIVRLFRKPDEDPAPLCGKCSGERRDQPVVGMTILWGLRRDGDEWSGGEILDPETGDIYRARLRAVDGGARLEVRGFIGVPLLGRTQVWQRARAICDAGC
jgi:uncharacterized protein (DUF2147 family)